MRFLALIGLWTAGVSWPLLSNLATDSAALVTRRAGPLELMLLTLTVTLLAPSLLAALIHLLRDAGSAPARALLPGTVCVLLGACLLHLARAGLPREGSVSGDVLLVLSALLAGGLSAAWLRWRVLRLVSAWLSPGALLVAIVFLSDSSVRPLLAGWRQAPAARPVVLVVCDELPLASLLGVDGGIDAGLFPQLANLARRGLLATNASTVQENRSAALAALISGRRAGPDPDRTEANDLFTLLGSTHQPIVWGADARRLCPAPLLAGRGATPGKLASDAFGAWARAVLPPPFDVVAPASPGVWHPPVPGRPAPVLIRRPPVPTPGLDRPGAWREFLAALDGDGPPPLALLHTSLPARPWSYLPDGQRYADLPGIDGLSNGRWTEDDWPPARGLQRHLLQLGLLDRLLGELLERMDQTGLSEHALVIVTATGGASFTPGSDLIEPGVSSAPDVISVPLLLAGPALGELAGTRDDRNLSLIDVLPTLAELLDRPVDPDWEGRSLLSAGEPRPFKRCERRQGPPVVLSGEAPLRRPALLTRQRWFGTQPTWDDVFGLSPEPDLVGHRVDQLGVAGLHPATAELRSVRGHKGELPCLLVGSALAQPGSPLPGIVAASLDDVIVAAARTERDRGPQVTFQLLLPDQPLQAGTGSLGLYAYEPGGRLLALQVVDWRMQHDEQGRVIGLSGSNGRQLQVRPAAFGAFLDQATATAHGVRVQGWAGDRLSSRPADTLLVFVGDRFVQADTTGHERPELPAALGDPALADAGFEFEIPKDRLGDDYVARTRLFAVVDDLATEVVSNRGGRWLTEVTWKRGDEGMLTASDGETITLDDPDLWGRIEQVETRGDRLHLSGWALDVSGPAPVDELIVLLDGESVARLAPGGAPHSVADLLGGQEVESTGFEGELPLIWFGGPPDGRLAIVARRGSRGALLRPSPQAAWASSQPERKSKDGDG